MPNGTAFDKLMWRLAYLYLAIPFIIFSIGWLKWFYSIPLIVIIIIACYFAFRNTTDLIAVDLKKHRRLIFFSIALLVVWVFFSGIGQFSFQNGDHYARNAVLKDLVEQPWPLVYDFSSWQPYGITEPGEYMLVYYTGFWMPAALFGKLFGLTAAHVFLFFWTFLGVILAFYFLCRYFKKLSWWMPLLLILFGGMDLIPSLLNGNYHPLLHLEWWHNDLQQYTSNTSLLYWVFNQSLVPWLVIGMFFNRLPKQNMAFICSLCFFYAPFPFIGLLPFAAYFFLVSVKKNGDFHLIFSIQNIVAALLVFLVAYGYFSSADVEKSFNLYQRPLLSNLWLYAIEFLLPAIIVLITGKRKQLTVLVIICLVVFSFVQYRHTPDLMMRASIPALFILMILCGEILINPGKQFARPVLIVLLAVGAVTSLNEIMRSVYYTGKYHYMSKVKKQSPGFDLLQQPDLFKGRNPVIPTMLGKKNAFFARTFCRER